MNQTNASDPSATAPLTQAIELTRRILFTPFELRKWFPLAFVAFLINCSQSGTGGVNIPTGFGNPGPGSPAGPSTNPLSDIFGQFATPWVVIAAASIVLFSLAIYALFIWIGSRANFVFIDMIGPRSQ